MKKLIKQILFLFLTTTLIVGCEAEDDIHSKQMLKKSQSTKVKQNFEEKSYDLKWNVSAEDLEAEVTLLTEDYSDNPEYEDATLTIEPIPQSNDYKFTLYLDGVSSNPDLPPSSEIIVCEGKGYSFAKCVANWLEENPTKCLLICSNGNGGFTADDENC